MNTNEMLNSYEYNTIALIEKLLADIVKKYDVGINFHDVIGFCGMNANLHTLFLPYIYHNNTFCNSVKKDETCFLKCIMNKNQVARKCDKTKKPFYGACYMGIEEYVFPLMKNNRLLAFFCIGQFCENRQQGKRRLQKGAKKNKLDFESLLEKHQVTCKENVINLSDLTADMTMLCKLIILALNDVGFDINEDTVTKQFSNKILQTANLFISDNYNKKISLRFVAAASFCSPVYLSKLFKNKIGMTVTDYINSIRINKAKSEMDLTNLSITEIAYKVGFNDSSYFTRVFKKYVGVSPTKFRSRS